MKGTRVVAAVKKGGYRQQRGEECPGDEKRSQTRKTTVGDKEDEEDDSRREGR